MTKQKIFCIGFHKTGTTSLKAALVILGYRVTGPNGVRDPEIARNVYNMVDALVPEYDAFEDNPWPVLYRYLDEKFPGNKFILTTRTPESWINSQLKHFGDKTTPMREWIYGVGCPEGNEEIYLNRYDTHNRDVREYFKDRPADFLQMDFTQGDGWPQLCAFLNVPVLARPFPHMNKATDRNLKSKSDSSNDTGIKSFVRRVRKIFSR